MEFKLNEQGIEAYVSSLTNKLMRDFFSSTNFVRGNDILKFTPYQQINFFILKNLFSDWKAEMTRLKSPYFDYDTEEVQLALNDLMNKLSHNIKISQEDFEGLLYNSIYDTIELVCNPKNFILNNLLDYPSEKISYKELKDLSKYIKTNSHYFEELLVDKSEGDLIILEELKLHLISVHIESSKKNLSVDSLVRKLSSLFPVTKSDFLLIENFKSSENEQKLVEKNTRKEKIEEPEVKKPAPVRPPATEEDKKAVLNFVENPQKLEKKTLNDKFQKVEIPKSLNDKMSKEEAENLADNLQHKSVKSIKSSIGLNQKFMFLSRLFDNSNEDYEFALNRLDDFETYEDVSNFLIDNYAQKFRWNEREKEVSELFRLIAKKF